LKKSPFCRVDIGFKLPVNIEEDFMGIDSIFRINKKSLFSWSGIVIIAFVLYFAGISHESIWWDESYSAFMGGHSASEILYFIHTDNHPPLYYLLVSLSITLFGNSAWALRLPSVLGSIGLVALGAGPVRRILGNKTALIFAVLALFTPVLLIYAHEARMYSLASFSVTACALYGFLALKENRRLDWVFFAFFSLTSAYLHYYGLMAAFFIHLILFVWIISKNRRSIKPYLVSAAVIVIGYLPWIPFFFLQIHNVSAGFWVSAVSLESAFHALVQPFAYKEIFPPVQPGMIVLLICSWAVVIAGMVLVRKNQNFDKNRFAWFDLMVFALTFFTPMVISLFFNPIFYERYIIILDGLFLLLLSLGVSLLPRTWLQVAFLAVYAVLNGFTLKDVYTQYFNYPMQEVAAYLKDEIKPGDLIVTSEQYSMGPALYYFPQATHFYSNNSIEKQWEQVLEPLAPHLHKDDERDQLLSAHKSFWYINCNTGSTKNIATILKGIKGWELSGEPKVFSEPYAKFNFTAAKYIYTGRDPDLKQGSLNLHLTGLNPPGNLLILLYNKPPMDEHTYKSFYVNFSGPEMVFPIDGLPFGEYAIVLYHDQNINYYPDYDNVTHLPKEGIGIVNWEKLDRKAIQSSFTFENLKFDFQKKEETVEVPIFYPPFTMLLGK
jgi:hypothetical protein